MTKIDIACRKSVVTPKVPNARFRFAIGIRTFETKAAAIAEVRHILNNYAIDMPLIAADGVLLRDLFSMHPDAAAKSFKGMCGIAVRINDFQGCMSRGFHVLHPDGTSTDFSYRPCFNAKLAEPSVFAAMRAAIMLGQRRVLISYFMSKEVMPCPRCNAPIRRQDAHVHHHDPKFRTIAADYIERFGEPETVSSETFGDDFRLISDKARWVEYHDARAVRSVLCAPCNFADERGTK